MTAPLQFGGSFNDGTGVFINTGKIVAIKDISGQKPFEKAENPCDLGMIIKLEIGKTFQPEYVISGRFKKESDVVTGWGSALCVKQTLDNFGVEGGLTEDQKFPETLLKSFLGKEVVTLSYIRGTKDDGKALWGRWNILAPAGSDAKLRKQFENNVKRGYPKDYVKPVQQDSVFTAKTEDEPSF